nr:reverse transcriptase domain-containing protein [Tanacetum cinerariifolium]
MNTRSIARNIFPPLVNPELTIQRRYRTDPTLLNDYEMVAKGNGDLPVPDLRTMEELCQPSLNGRGRPIALIAIQATNFGLKNDMIQRSFNSYVMLVSHNGSRGALHLTSPVENAVLSALNGFFEPSPYGTNMDVNNSTVLPEKLELLTLR